MNRIKLFSLIALSSLSFVVGCSGAPAAEEEEEQDQGALANGGAAPQANDAAKKLAGTQEIFVSRKSLQPETFTWVRLDKKVKALVGAIKPSAATTADNCRSANRTTLRFMEGMGDASKMTGMVEICGGRGRLLFPKAGAAGQFENGPIIEMDEGLLATTVMAAPTVADVVPLFASVVVTDLKTQKASAPVARANAAELLRAIGFEQTGTVNEELTQDPNASLSLVMQTPDGTVASVTVTVDPAKPEQSRGQVWVYSLETGETSSKMVVNVDARPLLAKLQ